MRYFQRKPFITVIIIGLVTLLMVSPLYSQGNGKGKGKGGNGDQNQEQTNNGNGQGQGNGNGNNQPQPETAPQITSSTNDNLLGCQKNNPDRLDCSSLEVSGYCDGTTAVFIIRNTGEAGNGDMLASTAYRLYQDGNLVDSGSVQLRGNTTMEIRYDGGGTITLEADQQVGHPGSSHPRTTLNCGTPVVVTTEAPTQEPTEEITPTPEVTPTEEVTPEPTEEITPEPTPEVTPTEEVTPEPTEEITPEPTEEVLPPQLWVEGECWDDGYLTFTVFNDGGDMTEPFYYEVNDMYGNILAADWLQIEGGQNMSIDVGMVSGPVTININNWEYYATAECISTTPEVELPNLSIYGDCNGGMVSFIITNSGSDMPNPLYYEIYDMNGGILIQDWLQLFGGESTMIEVGAIPGPVTINIDGWTYYTTVECISATQEVEEPNLWVDAYCTDAGHVLFVINNDGGDMSYPEYYVVTDADGNIIVDGWVQLYNYDSLTVEVGAVVGTAYIEVGDSLTFASIECIVVTEEITPTPEPTEEVTPTPEPTEEITPEPTEEVTPTPEPTEEITPEPTEEVTITPEPTEEVTPTPDPTLAAPLGCQKNNPDRLDCSSLQVTVVCEGSTAVFTIRNTGKPGEGDMVAATEYRLIVGGWVVETGDVEIGGGDTLEIRYSDGGRVTLQADQQTGHPGKSLPQATINCG